VNPLVAHADPNLAREFRNVYKILTALGASAWDDGQAPPYLARLSLQNLVGGIYGPRFDLGAEIYGSIQLPHGLKTSQAVVIKPHLHLINQNAIGASNYNVGFEFEWAWGDVDSTALSATTQDPQDFSFASCGALTHKLFEFSDVTAGTGQGGISSLFFYRLRRVTAADHAYDTDDIFFGGLDVHFAADSLGSRTPTAK
jgi:hypothetical protein